MNLPPPRYGEHSEEVLAQLGFEGVELSELLTLALASESVSRE